MIRVHTFLIGVTFCLALAAPPELVAQPAYTEDFTTTTYLDAANTTVDWSTADEELRPFPFVPQLAGSYDTSVDAQRVAIAGDLAYVTDGPGGLLVIDITNPASPVLVGAYNTSGIAIGVAVAGDLVLVADDAGGLVLIDVTNPAAPSLVGTYATADRARDVAVAGDLAFVADGATGLVVIDIEDPAAPVAVGAYDTPSFANGLAVAGNRAYVADGLGGLVVVGITDPALPALLGSWDSPGYVYGVAVSGTMAYLADGSGGLVLVDVSDPAAPVPGSTFATPGIATGVTVAGDLAFVSDGASGLTVVDVADPAAPALAVAYDTVSYARGVAVTGEYALVADGAGGLAVVAYTMPVTGALVGGYNPLGYVDSFEYVDVAGDLAVVSDSGRNLVEVIDISDPAHPVALGSVGTPASPANLVIDGDLAFVAANTAGLLIIDLGDPANPVIVGSYDTQGEAYDVAVAGDFAFVADNGVGLQVIDIADPMNPSIAAIHFTSGQSYGVAVAGDHAYLADGSDGLKVIDVSDPRSPTAAGTYLTQGDAIKVLIMGDLALVTNSFINIGDNDVVFVDVSDPANPAFVGAVNTSNAHSTAVSGNLAFLADGGGSARVIDISDPANPFWISNMDWGVSYDVSDVAVAGERVFLVDSVTGLRVFQAYQHLVASPSGITGQSLAVNGATDTILRARLTSEAPNDVAWELTAAGDTSWTPAPDGEWTELAESGTELRWRSTHDWSQGDRLTVTGITVDWLYEHAVITSVTDIANDQGRQVSLEWLRSGHDFLGDASQVTEYAVYRRIVPLKVGLASRTGPASASAAVRDHAATMTAAGWHFLTTVPVRVEDDYAVVVPTLADSSITDGQHFSTFMVSAMTAAPGVFYDSSPDSGYSVDNLAPGVPAAITAAYAVDAVALDWADAPESDFRFYRVYRGTEPGFAPGAGNLVQETSDSDWTDPTTLPWDYHYKITAVDHSGNEGEPGAPSGVSGTGSDLPPAATTLGEAVPNPFNPATRLSFAMATPGHARLRVYDSAGRLVATLVDGPYPAGNHTVVWDGRDTAGRVVASGVYLYRLEAGTFRSTRKMVLMK